MTAAGTPFRWADLSVGWPGSGISLGNPAAKLETERILSKIQTLARNLLRFPTGIHDQLGLHCHVGPAGLQLATGHNLSHPGEHLRLLGRWVAIGFLCRRQYLLVTFHNEDAAVLLEVADFRIRY